MSSILVACWIIGVAMGIYCLAVSYIDDDGEDV